MGFNYTPPPAPVIHPEKGITRCNVTACQCDLTRRGRFRGAWNSAMNAWYCIPCARGIDKWTEPDMKSFIHFKGDEDYPTEPEFSVDVQ